MLVFPNALTALLRLHEKPRVMKGTRNGELAELAKRKAQFYFSTTHFSFLDTTDSYFETKSYKHIQILHYKNIKTIVFIILIFLSLI